MGTKEEPDLVIDCYITVNKKDFDNIQKEFIVEPVVNNNKQVIELSIYNSTKIYNYPNNTLIGYILQDKLDVINSETRQLLRFDKINKVTFSLKLKKKINFLKEKK